MQALLPTLHIFYSSSRHCIQQILIIFFCLFQVQQPISNSPYKPEASPPRRISRHAEKAKNTPLRLLRLQQSVHQKLPPQSTSQDTHR